jgi:hypothetical protein
MAEKAKKVGRLTTAETGVAQELLDAHYDAVDRANEEGRDDAGRAINTRKEVVVEDKAVAGPKAKKGGA